MKLAQSYVPKQEFKNIYAPECALQHGTVFGDLHAAAGTDGKKIAKQKDNALLVELSACAFTALDLQLFIDVNPTDGAAIQLYNETVKKYHGLKAQYEKTNGPLRNFVEQSPAAKFTWIHAPWPWE